MTAPSKLDEARLRELADAATPGPWVADDQSNPDYFTVRAGRVICRLAITPHSASAAEGRATAELIAAARAAIPSLLDALSAERVRGDRAVWMAIEDVTDEYKDGRWVNLFLKPNPDAVEHYDTPVIGRWVGDCWDVPFEDGWFLDREVTHFRPMPAPPLSTQKAEG